jgi:hypothetical protein
VVAESIMPLALIDRKANIHAGFRAVAIKRSTLESAAEKAGILPVKT